MWRENQAGDFYWPLHREREQDHLRVWQVDRDWRGALVIDGEYLDPSRVGPFGSADEAQRAVFKAARHYVAKLAEGFLL